jgi:rhamnosyltransferase
LRLSLVIRALNEEKHIGRLLTGISRQASSPDEIILVDSGSEDATVEIATRFGAKVVHISPSSFSFGRSLNLGCEAATGDVVVIASAHVYPVYDDWLDRLVAPFHGDQVGVTYGRQVGDKRTKFSEHRLLAQWFPAESDLDQKHPFCNNANAAVRREVWARHRYDERLTGLEDLEFAARIMVAGCRIAYVAEAVTVHVHEESWQQIFNRYRREAMAHRRIFHDQRVSLLETAQLIVSNIAGDAIQASRNRVLPQNAMDIMQFRIAQFLGTYSGFRQQGPVSTELKRRFYYPSRPQVGSAAKVGRAGNPIDYGSASEGTWRDSLT